jgi:hypothetical protein
MEDLVTVANVKSRAPNYPLMRAFGERRTLVSTSIACVTFLGVLRLGGNRPRNVVIAVGAASSVGVATALFGELIDVVTDTLLPK